MIVPLPDVSGGWPLSLWVEGISVPLIYGIEDEWLHVQRLRDNLEAA